MIRARVVLEDESFTRTVMDRLAHRRRLDLAAAVALCLLVLVMAMLFHEAAVALAAFVTRTVVDLDTGMLSAVLAPLNSVGGLVAVALLVLRAARRRIVG